MKHTSAKTILAVALLFAFFSCQKGGVTKEDETDLKGDTALSNPDTVSVSESYAESSVSLESFQNEIEAIKKDSVAYTKVDFTVEGISTEGAQGLAFYGGELKMLDIEIYGETYSQKIRYYALSKGYGYYLNHTDYHRNVMAEEPEDPNNPPTLTQTKGFFTFDELKNDAGNDRTDPKAIFPSILQALKEQGPQ